MGRLNGLVALVTGGGRGIGRAIALEMAREGASIVVSSRSKTELDAVVAEAQATGAKGLAIEADAMVREQCYASVETALAEFGKVDIVVNNVGGVLMGKGPQD